jgi:hypothetical protein
MKFVKNYSLTGASILLGLCVSVITASACTEASPDYHDGGGAYNVASSNPTGVFARITSDDPFVCSDGGVGGLSTAYVMLENSQGNAWAQVGWWVDPYMDGGNNGPIEYSQWEYNYGQTAPATALYGSNGTGTNAFQVVDDTRNQSNGGFIYFSVNGINVGQVYWNNVFGLWPCDGFEYSGEAGNTADQMPGTSPNPVEFSSIDYMSWHTSTNTMGTAQPYLNTWVNNLSYGGQYNADYSSQGWFQIWDIRSTAK